MPKDQNITPEQLANIPLPPQFEKLVTALHSQYYSQQGDVLKDIEQGYKMIIGGLVLKLQQLEKENQELKSKLPKNRAERRKVQRQEKKKGAKKSQIT